MKLKYLLVLCVLATGCNKMIDDAYQNPNAQVVEPIETLMPNVISNMVCSYTSNGTNYGAVIDDYYIGRYLQYWCQNSNAYQYDRMAGATGTTDILGGIWAAHYYGMGQNLNQIVIWGIGQQKWDYVGAAWALRAWSWLTLTDQYGEVILKEAFNTSRQQFDYDSQEEVYDTVRATAFRALYYLNKVNGAVSDSLAVGDAYLNKGNINKWKKFVYGVLARSYNHLSNKAEYQPDSVIKYCDLAMTTNDDNIIYTVSNAPSSATKSYFGPYRANIGGMVQGQYIADLMSGANGVFTPLDPRAYYLLRENDNGTFKGARPNHGDPTTVGLSSADLPKNFWGGAYVGSKSVAPRYLYDDASPWPIMTASEMQFMKAEAAYRKGDKATALQAYENGISLSFDMVAGYPNNIPAGKAITPDSKAAYMADASVTPTTPDGLTLTHIMLQKYIAMYAFGVHEVWVDMRRFHYTDTDPVTGQQVYANWQPLSADDYYPDNNQKPVYRCRPRYNSEYLYNIPALQSIGAIALDYHTKECWFSQK
jgi:hypothetical protein